MLVTVSNLVAAKTLRSVTVTVLVFVAVMVLYLDTVYTTVLGCLAVTVMMVGAGGLVTRHEQALLTSRGSRRGRYPGA